MITCMLSAVCAVLLGLVGLAVLIQEVGSGITFRVKTGKIRSRSAIGIAFPLLILRIITETQVFLKLQHECRTWLWFEGRMNTTF